MTINYGNWQDLQALDGQNQWVDPHKNAFGGMLRALDPMTYVPGVNVVSNAVHDAGDAAVTGLNTVLSPVVKATNTVLKTVSPGVQQMENAVPMMGGINRFAENKPADALALVAATFFTGGAAAGAMDGAGAAAVPAAAEGAGATAAGGLGSMGAAGSAAITPAFESGAVAGTGAGAGAAGSTTGSLVGAGAITPALGSGAYGGIAGASGSGMLGTAGTAAANSAITPSFASMGGSGYGVIDKAKSYMGKAQDAQRYQKSFSNFSTPDTNQQNATQQANNFAQKILDSNTPPSNKMKRITDQIAMNQWQP